MPRESVVPALTHARHLEHAMVTKHSWERMRDAGERVWLFRPTPAVARVASVRRYLRLGRDKGGCDRSRFKVETRKLWYRTSIPDDIGGFISGMSRRGPWICLTAMPGLTASNTLYVVRFRRDWDRDARAAWALTLLTSKAAESLQVAGRKYADGLVKFEPGDLADLPIPIPPRVKGAYSRYRQAVAAMLDDRLAECRQLADQWFSVPRDQKLVAVHRGKS